MRVPACHPGVLLCHHLRLSVNHMSKLIRCNYIYAAIPIAGAGSATLLRMTMSAPCPNVSATPNPKVCLSTDGFRLPLLQFPTVHRTLEFPSVLYEAVDLARNVVAFHRRILEVVSSLLDHLLTHLRQLSVSDVLALTASSHLFLARLSMAGSKHRRKVSAYMAVFIRSSRVNLTFAPTVSFCRGFILPLPCMAIV